MALNNGQASTALRFSAEAQKIRLRSIEDNTKPHNLGEHIMIKIFAALFAATMLTSMSTSFAQEPSLPKGSPVKVTAVTQSLPTLPQYTQVELPIYKDKVPAWSNGRVTINSSTWAESGVSGNDILRLVRQGQADVGASPLASVAGDVPFLEIADLAGLSPTVDQARKVSAAAVNAANDELKRFGIKIIATYPFPANVIFCRTPVKQLSDLSGRKVRTFGPSQNDLVLSLGAQPVSVGFPEVYGALERGVADCAVTAASSANAAKWFEVTKYMYNLPVSWGTGGYYVNLAWWESLPPDVRTFVEGVYKQVEDGEWALAERGTADGLACNTGKAAECKIGTLVSEKNVMINAEPTPGDADKLRQILVSTVVPKWIARCGGERCAALFDKTVAPVVGFKAAAK